MITLKKNWYYYKKGNIKINKKWKINYEQETLIIKKTNTELTSKIFSEEINWFY